MASRWFVNLVNIRNPIFAGNLQHYGLIRIIPAALAMYLLIPLFIFLHIVCLWLLYNSIVCTLLGIERVHLRNYIIIDRHKLQGLSYTGRFHCIYCGYANGTCVAFGVMLTRLAAVSRGGVVAALFFLLATLLSSLAMTLIMIVYNIAIALPLGLHTRSLQESLTILRQNGFADAFALCGNLGKPLLRYEQASHMVLANVLEQIESQWCPVKHLPREGAVFPEHHKFFVERCELCQLKVILARDGSVSPRKPKY